METLSPVIEPFADRIVLIADLADRWSCGRAVALRRVQQAGIQVTKFNKRCYGVKLSDVTRLERELSE